MFKPDDVIGIHINKARKDLTKHGYSHRVVKDHKGWIKVGSTGVIPERVNLTLNEIDVVVEIYDDLEYVSRMV